LYAGLMVVVTAWAAHIEEEFGEIEVAFVAVDAVELGEAHLNDFVAGPDVQLVRAEGIAQQIGFLDGDVEEVAFTGGLIMCGRRLFVSSSPRRAAAARSKLSMRPDFSHCSKAKGMVTSRLVSMRGAQKTSLRRTAVKGTGFTG